MNVTDFTTYIITNLVKNPDMIKISSFESDEDTSVEVLVSKEDIGAIIGKGGKNIKAIRTVIQAYAYLNDIKRVKYEAVGDDEVLNAFNMLTKEEGIIPALESSHAVAYAIKLAREIGNEKSIVVNLSGRGDKDIDFILSLKEGDKNE